MPKEELELFYANSRRTLVMEADIQRGWSKLEKTYGFFKSRWVPLREDQRLRCQLSFAAQPATFAERASKAPDGQHSAELEHIRLEYAEGRLRAEVDIYEHPWKWTTTTVTKRPVIFIDVLPFFQTAPGMWFDLRIWIVFHGMDTLRPPPTERDYGDGTALPGGLPETNRRKH